MNQGDDIREEIRDRIRIEALIGNYVALRPSGRRFKGLCPFHAEKTPSFNVDPERQMWRNGEMSVDPHRTAIDSIGNLGSAIGVTTPDRCRQPIVSSVSSLDDVIDVSVRHHRQSHYHPTTR